MNIGETMMQIGDLCKVIVNNHSVWQLGDLILITRLLNGHTGTCYVEGINTRTGKRHHYLKENLEKL